MVGESSVEKRKYHFHSCTKTAGKPFEHGPRCPLYLKIHEYLKSNGWGQIYYNAYKTGTGDICNSKYRRLEDLEDKDVLSMLEVNIEGTKKTCTLTAILDTYNPNNILKSIGHVREKDIITGLDGFFDGKTLPSE